MISKAEEYQNSEKPYQAGTFQVLGDSNYYNVDLYWPKAKIMIFGAENDEEYTIAAKASGSVIIWAPRMLMLIVYCLR